MKAKLQHLMDQLQLKPGQFARILEINPAIISHILAERNKPGVDLLQKILRKFPQVNPDWLLLDSEDMFRPTQATDVSSIAELPQSSNANTEQTLFASDTHNAEPKSEQQLNFQNPNETPNTNAIQPAVLTDVSITNKSITHVVLFYADGSFESYIPKINGK